MSLRSRIADFQAARRLLTVVMSIVLGASFAAAGEPDKSYEDSIKPIITKHCVECHQGEDAKGKLRLDQSPDFKLEQQLKTWQKAIHRIQIGEMPPEEKPRLSEQELATLSTFVSQRSQAAEARRRAEQGRVVLRRLNRVEYENTIRDLLGIEFNVRGQFPADGMADGFDNGAVALHTSPFLMERYLQAADQALNLAIANRPEAPKRVDKRYSIAESYVLKNTTENVYRHLEGEVVCFCSSAWHNVVMSVFYPPDAGLYRFRISASAFQSDGKSIPFRVTHGNNNLSGKSGLVGYFDAPAGEPKVVEFTQYMEPKTTISILPYGLAGANTVKAVGGDKWEGPGLAVQYVEIEGPLFETWPPESHRRLFGELKQKKAPIYNQSTRVEVASEEPLADVERILKTFARRAFRRPATDSDVKPFVEIVRDKLAASYSFEQAVRAALKGMLISPSFLFFSEQPGKLDDFALANRLSYFLWSTMPDETLFALAEQGQLSKPGTLREQIERMLKDPKAAAFTENFVGQWLALREIDATEPSMLLYPEFDHPLKYSMIRETELFFEEILKNDLSVSHFISSDFSILNGRLAKHYGIPDVTGWEFRKTPLPADSHRGGLLTMASVLKITANGTNTSPVTRGAWILDRILGKPPSPPPEGAGVIEPDIRGAKTIREQLAKHRTAESCNSCHKSIDPPGFALESFDCIGGWRDRYRVTGNGESVVIDGRRMSYHRGKPVDSTGETAAGERFASIDEFKQILLKDQDLLVRSLATKLLTYATGAAPTAADEPAINAIVDKVRAKDRGLRSLIHEVVQSELFKTK